MLTLLSRLDIKTNLSMNAPSLLILDENWRVKDFLCSRLNLKVLSDIKEIKEFEGKVY